MSTSRSERKAPRAAGVRVTRDSLVVDLTDGRTLIAPLTWFPRLAHASARERANSRLIARGEGIHWPDVDEDISVAGLLGGRRSGETRASLRRWLATRTRTARQPRSAKSRRRS